MRSTSFRRPTCISVPSIISAYRCLVMVGHDEYWSWQMRDAIDAYVDQGGRIARFAGNFMWQIRLEQEGDDPGLPQISGAEERSLHEGRARAIW